MVHSNYLVSYAAASPRNSLPFLRMGEETLLRMPPPSLHFFFSVISLYGKIHVLAETEAPHELEASLG